MNKLEVYVSPALWNSFWRVFILASIPNASLERMFSKKILQEVIGLNTSVEVIFLPGFTYWVRILLLLGVVNESYNSPVFSTPLIVLISSLPSDFLKFSTTAISFLISLMSCLTSDNIDKASNGFSLSNLANSANLRPICFFSLRIPTNTSASSWVTDSVTSKLWIPSSNSSISAFKYIMSSLISWRCW